jgi:hypothetical protein
MTQPLNLGNCCGPSIPGVRKITFPDGDQVGLMGLDDVMEAMYREGKAPDDATISEMIDRLREKNNYISHSPSVQALYEKALFGEYRRFVEKKKR